jgi:DNA-binding NarL/FixJ family response regulator
MEVVAKSADGEEAVKLSKQLMPDVAIIDIAMPRMGGIEAIELIKKACPKIAILALSAYDYESYVLASLQAGASGYLLKDTPIVKLLSAIRMVHEGHGAVLYLGSNEAIKDRLRYDRTESDIRQKMHARELEVLKLAAKGLGNKEIAKRLGISERTIQSHFMNVFKKLGVNSRAGAVLAALRRGWLTLEDLP